MAVSNEHQAGRLAVVHCFEFRIDAFSVDVVPPVARRTMHYQRCLIQQQPVRERR